MVSHGKRLPKSNRFAKSFKTQHPLTPSAALLTFAIMKDVLTNSTIRDVIALAEHIAGQHVISKHCRWRRQSRGQRQFGSSYLSILVLIGVTHDALLPARKRPSLDKAAQSPSHGG